MLRFQLSSLVNFVPANADLTYTLFYSPDDSATQALIEEFNSLGGSAINWDWQPLARQHLFRRAIGRNNAASRSRADWVWFSDCDLIFHAGCIDSLVEALQGRQIGLAFPDHEYITELLPAEHPMLAQQDNTVVDIEPELFSLNPIHKAKGAFQIVHGDIARAVGYCGSLTMYQQPTETWRKTFEDSVFRKVIGYEGVALPVQALYRIRHQEKGRYAGSSVFGEVRKQIRRKTD